MFFLCIICPWLILFIHDDPVGALIALVMQVTLIGWIPASMWAWRSVKKAQKEAKEKKEQATPSSESRDVK